MGLNTVQKHTQATVATVVISVKPVGQAKEGEKRLVFPTQALADAWRLRLAALA